MRSGQATASAIAKRFTELPIHGWRAIRAQVREESLAVGVTYQPAGEIEVTDLVLVPFVLSPRDIAAIRSVVGVCAGVAQHIPMWREESPWVRALLPLEPGEEQWMNSCGLGTKPSAHHIVGRWDLNVVQGPGGRCKIRLFEGNGTAVGGINYSPAAEAVVGHAVASMARATGGRAIAIRRTGDLYDSFFRMCGAHARRLGRRLGTFVFLEDRTWDSGITEAPYVVAAMRRRGVWARLADPRDLRIVRGEVCIGRRPVDVVYRNMELRDFLEIERESGRLDALREAFRRGMVLSSLAGEFDHKSLLEVMTLPEVVRAVPAAWRRTLKKVVPWTRLITERRCEGPGGRPVDLPAYVRTHRERLVMKPNRSCGGEGVTIGHWLAQDAWERVLGRALRHPGDWVVQELITPAEIPVPGEHRGRVEIGCRFANCGVITVPGGPFVLGRSSAMPVVNVSRGGGIVAVMRTA